MPDVYDKTKRSIVMRKVRSNKNKSTEICLMKLFQSANITGWRRNYPVKGKPDFVFIVNRVAIFVDGCFWHGHNCRNITPKNNFEYWDKKLKQNKKRDIYVTEMFVNRGWTVLRIWECELIRAKANKTLQKIISVLNENK